MYPFYYNAERLAREFPHLLESMPDLEITVSEHGDDSYLEMFRKADELVFDNGGRYSEASRQRLNQYRQAAINADIQGLSSDEKRCDRSMPTIVTLSIPVVMDEDAEVIAGGMLAACFLIPGPDGWQLYFSVRPDCRRHGLGKYLMRAVLMNPHTITTWVSRQNAVGNIFLASNGWGVTAVDSGRSVRWTANCGQYL